ncbi:hypothetical protein GCM10029964_124470 [Kibdelosporangium lantanae]
MRCSQGTAKSQLVRGLRRRRTRSRAGAGQRPGRTAQEPIPVDRRTQHHRLATCGPTGPHAVRHVLAGANGSAAVRPAAGDRAAVRGSLGRGSCPRSLGKVLPSARIGQIKPGSHREYKVDITDAGGTSGLWICAYQTLTVTLSISRPNGEQVDVTAYGKDMSGDRRIGKGRDTLPTTEAQLVQLGEATTHS